jgi:hypothetical protein
MQLNDPLTVDQIEFRIQSISAKGWAIILPYKDARVDMERLDAVYGVEGWQRKHEFKDGRLYCSVGIYSEKLGQWVWKEDVGTQSNTEQDKGQASDAFKRACFNLGIGRELYDYPLIMVQLYQGEFTAQGNKGKQTYGLKLKQWKWSIQFTDGKLNRLAAKDQNGNIRFEWGKLKVEGEK